MPPPNPRRGQFRRSCLTRSMQAVCKCASEQIINSQFPAPVTMDPGTRTGIGTGYWILDTYTFTHLGHRFARLEAAPPMGGKVALARPPQARCLRSQGIKSNAHFLCGASSSDHHPSEQPGNRISDHRRAAGTAPGPHRRRCHPARSTRSTRPIIPEALAEGSE